MPEVTTTVWSVLNRPGVAQEMCKDSTSGYWTMCYEAVSNLVGKEMRRRGLPPSLKEDLVQSVMLAVTKGLPGFRGESRFTSWLAQVAVRKVIDEQRQHIRDREHVTSLDELEEVDCEAVWQEIAALRTVEDDVLVRERVYEALVKLREFVAKRRKAERDEKILNWALLDDRKCQQIADELAVDEQVIRNIVCVARRYLREQLGNEHCD